MHNKFSFFPPANVITQIAITQSMSAVASTETSLIYDAT